MHLTDEQQHFRDTVVRFAQRELSPSAREEGGFSRDRWRACASIGLLGLGVPREYGGAGVDARTIALVLEALGYGCTDNGLVFSINAHLWSCVAPVVQFGDDAQRERYLPGLCDGTLMAAFAMTEPEAGSDAFSLTTTAVRDEDGYVLNGSKAFVTNAPEADVLIVFATTDRELGFAGLTAFLVDRGAPGLEVGPPAAKMGLTGSPMADVFLGDCRVPAGQVLGRPGAGMAIFNGSMIFERGLIMSSSVGTMQRQLERAIAYARERTQFGQPIGSFQAVAHRIAEMKVRLDAARLLLYRFAELLDEGEPTALDAAVTKLHLSESLVQSSLDVLHLHGAGGYMADLELERDVRDALASRIYSGTSEIQRTVIARGLGL